ncbi:MAG TPA: hypothetical protein PLN53_02110 [Terricaulis sp.]|nr:hypothetical protein [Terricaulis sp.]
MSRWILPIVLGGVIAGALDILYAFAHYYAVYQVPPVRILQSVAAGAIGREAASAGGWVTGALGLGLHFSLTTIMAAFFVAWTRMVPELNKWPWLSGATYGLGIFAIMQTVVLPMSAAGGGAGPEGQFLVGGLLIHAFGVGLPIALIAKRFGAT